MGNVIPHPLIAKGTNAGQQRPMTDLVLDGLTAIKDVVVKLKRNGMTVIGAHADSGVPTVQVDRHRLIDELLEAGQAGYYRDNHTERYGEFFGEANDGTKVRVVWVEKKGH